MRHDDFRRRRDDFDRRWKEAERSHRRFGRLVFVLIAVVWTLVLTGIAGGIYLLTTTSPEEAGGFLGRIVAGFRGAA